MRTLTAVLFLSLVRPLLCGPVELVGTVHPDGRFAFGRARGPIVFQDFVPTLDAWASATPTPEDVGEFEITVVSQGEMFPDDGSISPAMLQLDLNPFLGLGLSFKPIESLPLPNGQTAIFSPPLDIGYNFAGTIQLAPMPVGEILTGTFFNFDESGGTFNGPPELIFHQPTPDTFVLTTRFSGHITADEVTIVPEPTTGIFGVVALGACAWARVGPNRSRRRGGTIHLDAGDQDDDRDRGSATRP